MALLTTVAGGIMMSDMDACEEDRPVSIEVDPRGVICRKFMGFGVEWDSANYDAAGVTDADFAVIRSRVEWMRLPIARIMMQSKWCYKGNGRFDWDDPQMKALCRHLDVCQKLGTTVVLTDWGIERDWLEIPNVAKVEDPKYAEIIATYMDYLLNTRNYTCIKYFIMVNEPNLYVFSTTSAKTDKEGFPVALDNVSGDLDAGMAFTCEANRVPIISSGTGGE